MIIGQMDAMKKFEQHLQGCGTANPVDCKSIQIDLLIFFCFFFGFASTEISSTRQANQP